MIKTVQAASMEWFNNIVVAKFQEAYERYKHRWQRYVDVRE